MDNLQYLFCNEDDDLKVVLQIINKAPQLNLPSGIAVVVNKDQRVLGTITDGDIRRALLNENLTNYSATDLMNKNPIYFDDTLTVNQILTQLPKELSARGRKSNKFLGKILIVDKNKKPVRIIEYHELWEQRVANHRHIVVVGLGYVGLTMAVVMADAGFMVSGVEVDPEKRELLNSGKSYIHELGLEELLKKEIGENFSVLKDIPDDGDVYIISVGTPVELTEAGRKNPNLTFLEDAAKSIGKKLQRGNLVILRSTVPIGTSRSVVVPILEGESGLKCGTDFYLSFAPERTAEGRALKELRSLPQIIGGYNLDSVEVTAAIFRDLTPTLVKVNSLEEAEMAKLINNSFRDYIFAFSNQMAKIASRYNIDVFNVIKAANDGYVRDPVPMPSPGVGGPCLTKDPHIFASIAERVHFNPELFTQGREINESMHDHVVKQIEQALSLVGKSFQNVKIMVAGLAFKGYPETGDIRNSSGLEIAKSLKKEGAYVTAYDPVASHGEIQDSGFDVVDIPRGFNNVDVVVFLNNHRSFEKIDVFNMVRLMAEKPIVYDGWNLFRATDILSPRPSVYMNLSVTKHSLV